MTGKSKQLIIIVLNDLERFNFNNAPHELHLNKENRWNVLTLDEYLHRHRNLAGAHRWVGRAAVSSLISNHHWVDDEHTLFVRSDSIGRRNIQNAVVLRPDDQSHRRVGVDRALNFSEHSPGQINSGRHVQYPWHVYKERHEKCGQGKTSKSMYCKRARFCEQTKLHLPMFDSAPP